MSSPHARIDWDQVDDLAVEFACNGTQMRLNKSERIVAIRRLLGLKPARDIAVLVCTYDTEVSRIAKATPGTMLCPYCRQWAYVDEDVLRRHVDPQGAGWCPQSGEHREAKSYRVQDLTRVSRVRR